MIHPSAHIDPKAELGQRVRVGAGAVIGADVRIGDDSSVGPNAVIEGPTTIGSENRIWQFAALGSDPQDKKYHGERSELVIGDRNVIREFCTFSRGTHDGNGATRIGNDNWIMAYVHIAHDCVVGDGVVFANAASLAGHVAVGDHVIFGGFTLVHQFCKIGAHAFTSMGSVINRDVPPYVTVSGNYAVPRGINSEGLKRRGFDRTQIAAVKRAYRTLYLSGNSLADARSQLAEQATASEEVRALLAFIEASDRSLVR